MDYQSITTDAQLRDFCRELASCPWIAIDTEFVSEHTYRSELCLVQVSAGGRLAVVDPLAVHDMRPFWEVLCSDGHETILHAGRGELEFCLQAVDRLPPRLFDVQIAAALTGIEYPASYGTLLVKVLGGSHKRHETRTDWRRRPLAERQIEYALDDVHYLPEIRDSVHAKLAELGRLGWLEEEIETCRDEVRRAVSGERWRRVSGSAGLGQRALAVVRELWKWRDAEARRRDQPARRVLRDDLIVELAKRQTADVQRIRAVRGMERGDLLRRMGELAGCIQKGLDLPEEQCPPRPRREPPPQFAVLGQFLFAALGSFCRQSQLAPNLVGGPADIRDWIAHRFTPGDWRGGPPPLARGWRAELVGRLLDDMLAGRISIRVGDPQSEHPLLIERSAISGQRSAADG